MRFFTPALAIAACAAGAATAEPIVVVNAKAPDRTASSTCAAARGDRGEIECVLALAPPRPGGRPAPAARILIRAEWASEPCAARTPQVVTLSDPRPAAGPLPIVEQAPIGRGCPS